MRATPLAPQPQMHLPPPIVPIVAPHCPQGPNPVFVNHPPIDNLSKYRAEEFRGKKDDDPARVEYWLENTLQVLVELMCTLKDCLRCAVKLLKEESY